MRKSEDGISTQCRAFFTWDARGGGQAGGGGESGAVCFFSLTLSKAERRFRSESYAAQIHGGSNVKGRGFNNIAFLRFGVFGPSRCPRYEMPSETWRSPGKHRCSYTREDKRQREVCLVSGKMLKIRNKKTVLSDASLSIKRPL